MQSLNQLAEDVGHALQRQKLKLATAESCTGGMVAMLMTSVAGSSAWFDRGWVTYSNAAKISELEVESQLLDTDGAVSRACVLAMAQGAIRHSQAHVSVAISGIAGPDGGTTDKPVGTVWLAWGQKLGYAEAELFHFKGDRASVREQAAEAALNGLWGRLHDKH